jgi:hypothetical protein
VKVRQESLPLSFPAKSGKIWESEIADADLRVLLYREGDVVSIGTPAEIPAANQPPNPPEARAI